MAVSRPTAELTSIRLAVSALPLTGRPAVTSAELAVIRELADAVLLLILRPAVIAAVPPVGTNKIGVVSMTTEEVCMKPRAAVEEVARADFVSRTEVLLFTRSIVVLAGIPGPVTSIPLAR